MKASVGEGIGQAVTKHPGEEIEAVAVPAIMQDNDDRGVSQWGTK